MAIPKKPAARGTSKKPRGNTPEALEKLEENYTPSYMVSFRLGPIREQTLRRMPYGSRPSMVSRRDLNRYYRILEKQVPLMSIEQCDTFNDLLGTQGITMEDIPFLEREIARRVERIHNADHLERTTAEISLVDRLNELSLVEKVALLDAIEQARIFEASDYSHEGSFAVVGLTGVI